MKTKTCFIVCVAWMVHVDVYAKDYYVDPLKGSSSFTGTQEQPWRTLEEVFKVSRFFSPGDRIFLRRGYHGTPTVTGVNTGMVSILAEEGHTPVFKWIRFSNAQKWHLQDVFIHAGAGVRDGQSALLEFINNSHENEVYNVWMGSTAMPWGWEGDQKAWLAQQKTGVLITSGRGNRIHGVHVMNVGNAMVVGTVDNIVEYNTVENFSRDGFVANGNNTIWQYNTLLNAVIADENGPSNPVHRDMFQTWNGAKTKMVIRGNTFISSVDVSKKFIDPRIPVLALWDGPFSGYLIENNVIFTDNGAGIWMNAGTNNTIAHNTCTRVSSQSLREWPLIKIGQKTASSKKSSNNVVYNNIADGFSFLNNDNSSSVSFNQNNLVVRRDKYTQMFLKQTFPHRDVRLSKNALMALDKGSVLSSASFDADMYERKQSAPDIGAYEYGAFVAADTQAPTLPEFVSVVQVPALGYDISWKSSSDNRWVAGYDVYRNGVHVGRTRSGTHFFDLTTLVPYTQYTVVAFDASSNKSIPSAAVLSLLP
jgi:hypothetical protein